MRILMLGWEFPPFIAGGLGTACYGLTKALDRLGHEITFVLPKAVDRSHASHVRLQSPEVAQEQVRETVTRVSKPGMPREEIIKRIRQLQQDYPVYEPEGFDHTLIQPVPAAFRNPYGPQAALTDVEIERILLEEVGTATHTVEQEELVARLTGTTVEEVRHEQTPGFLGLARAHGNDYGGDLMGDIQRYAELCLALNRRQRYDVVHAHDWMTFPAGMAVSSRTGTPMVVHVHSTEFDRSGENVNQQVYDIERRGMHAAMRVVCVSYWTRNIVIHRYGVDPEKIRVVWNGIERNGQSPLANHIQSDDRIVLFLGRITMQKGPEYFIAAAKRVLEKIDNVKFIVAGSGDMATRMIELAAEMGIGHKVLFTGFLRGGDVARVFRMADCYVMPSVSEPFGIAPLEAMSHDVPVIISKQSGVSEVLTHVLKVDFWDVDEMANKIIAVLRHPPLGQTLRQHGTMDLHNLTWEGAAKKCTQVYGEAIAGVPH